MFRDDARPHKRPRFELTPLSDDAPESSDTEEQRPLPKHKHKQKHAAGNASSTTSASTSTDAALDDAYAQEDALEPTLEQLEQEQSRNQSRFRHRMEDIFTRYAQDFNETADEIDIRTGHVVVDRGHWRSLPDVYVAEQDGFEEESSDFSSDEDGILDDHDADILDFLARPAEMPAWLNSRDSPAPGKSAHAHAHVGSGSKSLFQPRTHPVAPMARALQLPPDDVVLQQFGTAGPAVLDLLKRQAEAERRASSESPAPVRAASEAAGSDRGQTLRQEMDEAGEDDLSVLLDSPAHQLHAAPLVKTIDKVSVAMWPAGRPPNSNAVIEVVPDSDEDEADTTHPPNDTSINISNDTSIDTSSRRPFGSPERPKVQANPVVITADAHATPSEAEKRKALYRATLEAAWAKLDTCRSDQAPALVSPAAVQKIQTTVSSPLQATTPFKTPVRSSHTQPSQAHQTQSRPTNTNKSRSAVPETRPVRSQSLTAPSEALRKQAMLQHHQWQQQQNFRERMAGSRPRTDLTRELRALTAGYQDEAQTKRNARLTANKARESAAAAANATPTKPSLTQSSKTTPSGSASPASAWVPKEMRALFAGPRISAANDAATRAAKGYTVISGPVYRAEKRQEEAAKQRSQSTSRLRSSSHRRSSKSISPCQKQSGGQTPAKDVEVRDEVDRSASPTESDAARLLRPRRRLIKYSDKFHARPQYSTETESETRKQTPATSASATDAPRTPLYINLADEDEEDDLAGASPALSSEQVSARAHAAAARHARLYPPAAKSAAAKTEPIDYNPFDLMDEEDEISGLAATPAPVVRQQQQQQPTWILPPDTADGTEQEEQEAMLEMVPDSEEGHSLLSSSQSSGPLPAESVATPVHRRSAMRSPRQTGTASVSKIRCRPFKAQPTPPQTFLSPQQASAIGARLSAIAATRQHSVPVVRDRGLLEGPATQDRSFMQAPLFRACAMKSLPSVAGALAQPKVMSQDTAAALIQPRLKDLVDEAAGHGTDTVTRSTSTGTEKRGRLVDALMPTEVQHQAAQMLRRESDSENDRMAEEQLRGDVRAGFLPAEQMVIATLDLD